jgi:hypothetical protein
VADAVDQAHIVQRQHIGPHQVKDQEHLGRPAADAADADQLGDDGLVVHALPGLDMDGAGIKMQRQVDQVSTLRADRPAARMSSTLSLSTLAACHLARQPGELVPHGLRGLDRDLLPHDAARQRGEGVAAGLQAGIRRTAESGAS